MINFIKKLFGWQRYGFYYNIEIWEALGLTTITFYIYGADNKTYYKRSLASINWNKVTEINKYSNLPAITINNIDNILEELDKENASFYLYHLDILESEDVAYIVSELNPKATGKLTKLKRRK